MKNNINKPTNKLGNLFLGLALLVSSGVVIFLCVVLYSLYQLLMVDTFPKPRGHQINSDFFFPLIGGILVLLIIFRVIYIFRKNGK